MDVGLGAFKLKSRCLIDIYISRSLQTSCLRHGGKSRIVLRATAPEMSTIEKKWVESIKLGLKNDAPCSISKQLHTIHRLEHAGIERHFHGEVQDILSQAFRIWTVSSETIEEKDFFCLMLERHGFFEPPASSLTLRQVAKEIKFSMLPRLEHKNCITSSKIPTSEEEAAILALARADYNTCQRIFQEDVKNILKWYADYQFANLKYSKNKVVLCYFSAAATMFRPDLSPARIVWGQLSVLTTVIDDYFDHHDSLDDLRTFCAAVKRWDYSLAVETSGDMKLLLQGLFKTVDDVAEKAFPVQGRDISKHLRAQWDRLVHAYLKEAEWRLLRCCPSLEEYLQTGLVSFALEPILLGAIFFLGEQVDESVIDHVETRNMLRRVSLVGRLLNDLQGYKRECEGGESSWITVRMQNDPDMSFEECTLELRMMVEHATMELVDDLIHPRNMPRGCKQVFESMTRTLHFFYRDSDGFRSNDLSEHVKNLLQHPL